MTSRKRHSLAPRLSYAGYVLLTFLLSHAQGRQSTALASDIELQYDGHIKTRLLADWFPTDSVFRSLAGSSSQELDSELRFNVDVRKGRWDFDAAWQLYVAYGDRIDYTRSLPPNLQFFSPRLPTDDRRLFDLTSVIEDDGKFAAVQRLDRLSVGYTSDRTVLRFGRQALSWGNGLIFSPLDIVNPFDPVTVDTEYKAGDDMLYGQFLRDGGDDVQAAYVMRRDVLTGDTASDQATAAIKYHGIAGDSEYDLLIADHYDEPTFGVGGNHSLGGAVVRGDLVVSDARSGTRVQIVTNLSYSWVWQGKNLSGVVEYYYNGFGQKDGNYSLADISQNTELVSRLARGDTFTLGRNYLAAALTVELTPLWNLTPNLFFNVDDSSALLQVVTDNNLSQNISFTGAVNVPIGPSGSEFGGIATDIAGVYLSTDLSLFAQLAWYF